MHHSKRSGVILCLRRTGRSQGSAANTRPHLDSILLGHKRDALGLLRVGRAGRVCLGQHLLEFPRRRVQRAVVVVDQADGAGGNDLLQMQLDDLAALQRLPGHGFRHKGKAQLAFDQREHLVGGGGLGVKTGLYLLPPDAPFVDLCAGHPKRTQQSRCITARYGQTTLSNHKAERSGALLIKEATRKGYQEAAPGDSVDLGYPGSATRAGRVGVGVAHDAASVQGIVERGGRIRRLMPRECLRLQGFDDEQIDKILAINSDAQAYKQAGNSVTVTVIEAIGRRIRAVDEALRKEAAA